MKINIENILNNVNKIIVDYINENLQDNSKVVDYKSPIELTEILDLNISDNGVNYEDIIDEIKTYLKYSVKTGHNQFFNQLYSGFSLSGFLGELIVALTNTSMYTYEVAPVATIIEKRLIDKMCNIAGFEKGTGIFTSGGSNSNLIALFSARNKLLPSVKQSGMYQSQKITAFVSDQSHYSFGTAANLIGIGSDNLIKIKSDENGRMVPNELERAIISSLKRNELPFFIAATAGTTLLGAFDPIDEIVSIAKKFDCWVHVDGSFGGSILLNKKRKYLFKGIESVDSFAWNPHKLMNVPLTASVILLNDKKILRSNLTSLNTDYIFHNSENESCDLGEVSIQCGRKVDALKVWLAWKFYGDEGYSERIDNMFANTEYFASKINKHNHLELMNSVQTLTVCFRYNPGTIENLNSYNLEIREQLRKTGRSIVNYGYIDNDLVIRFVVSNGDLNFNDIDQFFIHFFEVIKEIENSQILENANRFNYSLGMAPNSR